MRRAWRLAAALGLVALALGPVVDFDIWWHLRAGQWIAEHHAVPRVDPFQARHLPWVEYAWLFDLLVLGFHALGGLQGLVAYRALGSVAVLAAFAFALRRTPRGPLAPGLAAALATFGARECLSERPWIFTFVGCALVLGIVLDLERGKPERPRLLALAAIFVVWGNAHIQFVYGLGVLAWAALFSRDRARAWARVALGTAAVLANPYGAGVYRVVWEYASQGEAFRLVSELMPPRFDSAWQWLSVGLLLAALVAIGRAIRTRPREALRWGALLLPAIALFLRARRDLWLADLVAVAALGALGLPGAIRIRRRIRGALRPVPTAIALGLAIVAVVRAAPSAGRAALDAAVAQDYPVAACDALVREPRAGPLYNDLNWGGYLIWRLHDLPVEIDGRTNLLTADELANNVLGWRGKRDDPRLAEANLVVADVDWPRTKVLAESPLWQQVYADDVARIFVRRRLMTTTPQPAK